MRDGNSHPVAMGPSEVRAGPFADEPACTMRRVAKLVVDDEDFVVRALTAALAKFGLKAQVANSGPEGIECFIRHRHDILMVLADIVMPGMLGTEMAKEILRIDPAAKILFMSGYPQAEPEGRVQAKFPFLPKPVLAGDLLRAIESMVGPVMGIGSRETGP